jgi:hypothetical protein
MAQDGIAAPRLRLAELAAVLARLRAQYDILMNAFRFEEARALVGDIEAAERERNSLAEAVPAPPSRPPAAPYAVARGRRRR